MALIVLLSDGGCGILGHYVNSDECIEKFGIARDVMHFQQLSKAKTVMKFSAEYKLKPLKAVYYTILVHNFNLQEKATKNNNNTITAK